MLCCGSVPPGTQALLLGDEEVPLAPDGRFITAFDRDHGRSATLTARLADGREIGRTLDVAPRQWRIEPVNVARRPGGTTPEFLRRREAELARIVAAPSRRSGSEGWRQRFIWPAQGRISGLFGSRRVYRGEPASFIPASMLRRERERRS